MRMLQVVERERARRVPAARAVATLVAPVAPDDDRLERAARMRGLHGEQPGPTREIRWQRGSRASK